MRPTRCAVILIALAAALAACSSPPHHLGGVPAASRAAASQPPVTVPAGYAHGITVPETAFTGALPAARRLVPGQSVLIGPHVVVQVGAVAVVTAIGATAARMLGLPGPISAGPGQQFIAADSVSGSYPPGLPECSADNDHQPAACTSGLPARLLVGRVSRPLPVGQGFVISVPAAAAVTLRLTDGGRAQDLNLRTGQRTQAASTLYYPVPRVSLTATATVGFAPSQLTGFKWYGNVFGVTLYGGSSGLATLAPYTDSGGWAPAGHAWLLISMDLISAYDDQFGITARVPRSFALRLPGGASAKPPSGTARYDAKTAKGSPGTVSLVFEVPASARAFTLVFAPDATVYPPHGLAPGHITAGPAQARKIAIRLPG